MNKRMSIDEFQKQGLLQEVNRQFFHPLGLALEIVVEKGTGEKILGGIWDYRNDPEGLRFKEVNEEKTRKVEKLRTGKAKIRKNKLGYVVQPVEDI